MTVSSDRAVFEVNVKGEHTGKIYKGKFTMKLFLSLRERNEVAVKYSRMNEGNTEDYEMMGVNRMIAEFLISTEEGPDWFKEETFLDIQDLNPLLKIKEELEKSQKEYSDKMNK